MDFLQCVLKLKYATYIRRAFAIMLVRKNNVFDVKREDKMCWYSPVLPFNRAYPENANSNTCAPNTLKFHTFCGLCVTKQCFKFELDILNSSGVIAT